MSPTPTTPNDEQEAQHYRAVLRKLVDIAMEHATALPPKPENAVPLDRIARTIRRCILLSRKLGEPLPTPRPTPIDRTAARKKILRDVEDQIYRQASRAEAAPLEAELRDRLDRPDVEDDLAQRPIHEIITEIARDLGVGTADARAFKWKRRTPEAVAVLTAQAAATPKPPPPANDPPPRPRPTPSPGLTPTRPGIASNDLDPRMMAGGAGSRMSRVRRTAPSASANAA